MYKLCSLYQQFITQVLGVKGHEQVPKQDTTSLAYNITRPWRVPDRYMQQYIRHLAMLVRIIAVQTNSIVLLHVNEYIISKCG